MSNALVVNTPQRPVPVTIIGGTGGGGGVVAGADTQVQFNDGGVFGGDAGLTYTKATKSLKVGGQVVLGTLGDTAITRSGAAGVAEVNNGTVGTYRDLKVRNLQVQAGGRVTGAGAIPVGGTQGQHLMKNTGTDYDVSWQTPGATKVIWLTTPGSGTYTPTTGVKAIYVEAMGGGGGSAGALGTSTPSGQCSGGGAGGSLGSKYYAVPAASYAYVVGAGGTAGAATPTAGGRGGDSTFGTTTPLTGSGGNGSLVGAAAGTTIALSGGGAPQGDISTSNGDAVQTGGSGLWGNRYLGASGYGGFGGASPWAGGVASALNVNFAGVAGYPYGGGASGASSANATGQAGAKGGDGAIKITEFF